MSRMVLNSSVVLPNHYQVTPSNLTQSRQEQLVGISEAGARCLIDSWSLLDRHPIPEPYCDAHWDGIHCWPATKAGETVRLSCTELTVNEYKMEPRNFSGEVHRICSVSATWLWDSWNSYDQCGLEVDHSSENQSEGITNIMFKNLVCFILFLGSIFSLLCLSFALFIFIYFRSIRCDRITVQIHLLLSLAMRCVLLIIISEPCIFQREFYHYRSVDWVCKVVLALHMYATVASVNWMFVQGHYLHSRVTTNVFYYDLPFKSYCLVGWGVPALLVSLWATMVEIRHPFPCWKNYGVLELNWIIVGPMFLVLFANLIFLLNIVRIYVMKKKTAIGTTHPNKFRRAVKAAVSLIPLLGMNFLFFAYNPGGSAESYYILTNAISQDTQGIFVSVIYCFFSKDVREAFQHKRRRLSAHRRSDRVVGPCKLVSLDVIYLMVNVGRLPETRNQLAEPKVHRASSPMPLKITSETQRPTSPS